MDSRGVIQVIVSAFESTEEIEELSTSIEVGGNIYLRLISRHRVEKQETRVLIKKKIGSENVQVSFECGTIKRLEESI